MIGRGNKMSSLSRTPISNSLLSTKLLMLRSSRTSILRKIRTSSSFKSSRTSLQSSTLISSTSTSLAYSFTSRKNLTSASSYSGSYHKKCSLLSPKTLTLTYLMSSRRTSRILPSNCSKSIIRKSSKKTSSPNG
jgi:hypothetical protein